MAIVGGESIGPEKYAAYLESHAAETKLRGDAVLEGLVRREVGWLLAGQGHLLEGAMWQERMRGLRNGILAQAYLATMPSMPSFTEAQAREFYITNNERRHVLHLLLETREGAEQALARLKKGEKIPDLAPKISKDPSAFQNRGDLGWIKRGQTVPPFEEAAFRAKVGELVGPVESKYGWHILLVEDVQGPPEGEFEKNRDAVYKEMDTMQKDMVRAKALGPLRTKYPLETDQKVLAKDRSTTLAAGDETLAAGKVGGQSISLAALKLFMAESLNSMGQSHALGPEIKTQFLQILADDARLSAAAVDAGLDRQPIVQGRLWDAEHEAGYQSFGDKYLATCAVPETDLRKFHADHTEEFLEPGQVKLDLLVIDSQDVAMTAANEATAGASWESLYKRYANKESTGNWNLGWVDITDLQKVVPPETIRSLMKRKPNAVVGPVKGPEGYEVFRLLDRKPGPPMSFEACRELVRARYIEANGTVLLSAYLDGEGRKGIEVRAYPAKVPKL